MGRLRKPKKGEPPFNTRSCGLCNELDTPEMVQCDECDKFFHFICVGVDDTVATQEWMCHTCSARKKQQPTDKLPSPFMTNPKLRTSPKKAVTATVTSASATPPITSKSTTPLSTKTTTTGALKSTTGGKKVTTPNPVDLAYIPESAEHARTLKELKQTVELLTKSNQATQQMRKHYEDELAERDKRHEQEITELKESIERSVEAAVAANFCTRQADEEKSRLLAEENSQLRKQMEEMRQHMDEMRSRPQVAQVDLQASASPEVNQFEAQRLQAVADAEQLLLEISAPTKRTTPTLNPAIEEILSATVERMMRKFLPVNSSHSSSAPVVLHGSSSGASVFDEAFDSQTDRSKPESSVDRLTVTMRRQYLQKLPTFNGNIKEWAAFEHVYNQTTIEGNFSPADNVARLREALRPPASQLVLSLILYSSDADRIMEELKDAYGKPEDLIATSLEEIFALPDISSQVDPGLRHLMILMRNYVATLDNLNAQTEMAGVYTLRRVVPKLHHNHQTEWHAIKQAKPNADLRDFAEFLVSKVKQIPTTLLSSRGRNFQTTNKPSQPDSRPKRINTHQQSSKSTARPDGCLNCHGNHKLYSCPGFLQLSTNGRWELVKQKQICSGCLKSTEHRQKDCPTKRSCALNGCDRFHNRALHNNRSQEARPNNQRRDTTGAQQPNVGNVDNGENNSGAVTATIGIHVQPIADALINLQPKTSVCMSHLDAEPTLFKIVPITICGRFKAIETFAFLDDGSQLTLLDQDIFDQLHLEGTPEVVHLQWSSGIVREEKSFRTEVTVSGLKTKERHTLTNVYTVSHLDLPSQSVDAEDLKRRYPHLRGLPIPSVKDAKPMILIGLKHPTFLNGATQHSAGDDEPIASKTRLGWAVYGPSSTRESPILAHGALKSGVQLTMSQAVNNDEELNKLVKDFFSVENFGVMAPKRDLVSESEKRANDIMTRTLKMVDGRYEIGLLWKSDNISLPDSWPMAMSRLRLCEKSLRKKPGMLQWKNNHVKELVAKGYARVATVEELKSDWDRVWYCPTFVTINANKEPPKPRDVCDVAATVNGQSLNSNLLKGPDNMAPLLQALFKFRENYIAVNGDVKEMFHQVCIRSEDQQCQRFLWRDGDDSRAPTVYVMQRMMFGPTCSPTCAQFVKNFHAAKFEEIKPEAAKAIQKTTYVDDYFNSHPTSEEAFRVVNDAIHICKTMGFQLVGFQSNDPTLLKRLPKDIVKSALVDIDNREDRMETSKLLGVVWHPTHDYITYRVRRCELVNKMINTDYCPTKREMLRTLMRIYDPLGLIAHYLIRGKIVLQEVWREGTGWDERVPMELQISWKEFITQLENIALIRIPRHYAPVIPSKQQVQLVVFVDASERAFAATAYFRFSLNEVVHVAQVMGKAKVAPIKRLTIPQLELQAALLGARMVTTIKNMHDFAIHELIFLSDSRVVLAWISSKKFNFKTFVASRIGEILDTTRPEQWFHVGTKDNVADDATKHSDPQMGRSDTRWFCGPEFLKTPIQTWPIKPAVACVEEAEATASYVSMVHLSHVIPLPKLSTIDDIKPHFKAKWCSLVRVTAFMLRMNQKRILHQSVPRNFVSPEEFRSAEEVIFKKIQHETFAEEIRELEAKAVVCTTSRILKLNPFLDKGLVRMRSRAQKAHISFASKNPPILPNKHELVDVLISHHHAKNFHMGDEMTIADVRERAWIIDIRSALQRVKRNCQSCKNARAKPQMPIMGELPIARVDFGVKPFTHVGLDAFGPYVLKRGRGSIKRYGLIFTCLTYRAVHLEMLDEMTTNACITAIRRFLVRRGWSARFYSDNGSNFRGANNLLHKELKELRGQVEPSASNYLGIRWDFIPAYSPWFGGAWERLIQSIKKCIEFVMRDEEPNETIFQNALIEAEFWMNRRPLTHTPIDHEDSKPLTPNSVLYGEDQENLAIMLDVYTISDKYSSKMHRRVQHLVDKFRARWVKEYLPQINRRSKWFETKHPLKVGDVVIITEPIMGKDAWKKGRIVKVHPGTDGVVRAADVMLPDQTIAKNRSTGRLAVLDVLRPEQAGGATPSKDNDSAPKVGSATLHF